MDHVQLENLSNEELGRLIRRFAMATGQGVYLPPVRRGRLIVCVLTELPPEGDYYQVGEYWVREPVPVVMEDE